MTLGAIPYTIICLAVIGLLLMVFGAVLDQILIVDNDLMQDSTLPYSKERGDTMNIISVCFKAMGFVSLISAGIFLVMNGTQTQSGDI
jgi:hypothetical protein